jgi:hypothetical protein
MRPECALWVVARRQGALLLDQTTLILGGTNHLDVGDAAAGSVRVRAGPTKRRHTNANP